MTTTRHATTTTAVLSLLLAAAPGCGPSDTGDGPEASDIGTDSAAIDSSFLPAQFQVRWAPGIPGGVPRDNDPVRPATVWLPAGNPYGGYSVNPALTGAGQRRGLHQRDAGGDQRRGRGGHPEQPEDRFPQGRHLLREPAIPPQQGRTGRALRHRRQRDHPRRGRDRTRLAANGTIPEYGTVVLFGHRSGFSDADFRVTRGDEQRLDEHQHRRGGGRQPLRRGRRHHHRHARRPGDARRQPCSSTPGSSGSTTGSTSSGNPPSPGRGPAPGHRGLT